MVTHELVLNYRTQKIPQHVITRTPYFLQYKDRFINAFIYFLFSDICQVNAIGSRGKGRIAATNVRELALRDHN